MVTRILFANPNIFNGNGAKFVGQVFAFASGKGGVGKTTLCSLTGLAAASLGKKTLVVELDSGLRGIDVLLGLFDRAVFDLSDALAGRCAPSDCCYPSRTEQNLFAVTAPSDGDFRPDRAQLTAFLQEMRQSYDAVFLDCPAGIGETVLTGCSCADTAVLLCVPETISVRDAAVLSQRLWQTGVQSQRLIINMVKKKGSRFNQVTNFDWVIDQVRVQLLGVVPHEVRISDVLKKDMAFSLSQMPSIVNIAKRLSGTYVPLSIQ